MTSRGAVLLTGDKGQFAAVVPFVEDRRNALIMSFATELNADTMASLLYALKHGIATRFQLEDSELDGELVPDHRHPNRIFFYEAAEGGAGVLSRLAQEPQALAEAARAALEVCHFDPDTGEDHHRPPEALEECEAACYACLLSYTNQRFHELLDRHAVRDVLLALAGALRKRSGADGDARGDAASDCWAAVNRSWSAASSNFCMSGAIHCRTKHSSSFPISAPVQTSSIGRGRPASTSTAPITSIPTARHGTNEVTARLEDGGYTVVRFADPAGWDDVLREYSWIFGEGRG